MRYTITLRELAVVCYIYKIVTKDVDNNDSYEQFRQAIDGLPDLCKQKHRMAILKFLNNYGCRHVAKDSHEKIASKKIADWYKKYCGKLPKEKERLWKFKDEKLKSFDELHSTLSKLLVACREGGVKVHMGPVGAAKMLFAIRPNVFPPWDNAIREELLKDSYSVESYADYLKYVKKIILGLEETCNIYNINIDDLPQNLDRPNCTMPKLIDEYHWITITKGFKVEEIVQRWDKWTKS